MEFIRFGDMPKNKCFLVSGDLVGYGTDGEPLIKNVKILQTINLISYE